MCSIENTITVTNVITKIKLAAILGNGVGKIVIKFFYTNTKR